MPDLWMDVDTALAEVPVNLMPLLDDTDFKTRETAIAFDAAGMDLVWNFVTTAGAMTQTAVTPTSAGNYDWAHQGDGMYSIEIPASGGASINNDTEGFGWFTGFATGVLPWRGPVIGFRAAGLNNLLIDDAFSATRGLAGTALPNAAADAAGGLPISDAGGLNLDGRLDAAITTRLAPTTAGRTLDVTATGAAGVDWGNVENPSTAVNLSATNIDVDQVVASVSGAVGSVTGAVGSVTAGVTLAASAVQAIWDALTSAPRPEGSVGKLLGDNINATISSRLPTSSYTAPLDAAGTRAAVGLASANLDTQLTAIDDFLDTEVAAILTDTNELQTDWANGGRLDLLIDAIKARTDVIAVPTRTGTAQAGAAGTITLDASASAVDDFYNNQILVITGGTGVGQARIVSDYVGSTKVATVNGNWATNPDNTSTFALLGFGAIPGATAPTAAEVRIEMDANSTKLASIEADTQDLQSRTPAALVSGRMDSHIGSAADAVLTAAKFASGAFDAVWSVTTRELTAFSSSFKTGYALSSAGVQAIWDALTSALTTAGSVGKLLVDNINATISSRLASASYTAPLDAAGTRSAVGLASANLDTQLTAIDDFLDTEVAAIKAKTDNLPATPAATGDAMALTSSERNSMADALLARSLGTESYAADGAVPTLAQALFMLLSEIGEFSISGTTITCKKLDGTTTSMTFTLDSSSAPTSRTRAT